MQFIKENLLDVKILSSYGSPNLKFDDEKLEEEYFNSNEPQKLKNSKIIFIGFFLKYLILVFLSLTYSKEILSTKTSKISEYKIFSEYVLFFSMLIDIFSNILLFKKFKSLKNLTNNFKDKIISLRIFWIILCFFLFSMGDILIGLDFNMISRNIYLIIFLKNVLYYIQCPDCIITMIILSTEVIIMICLFFFLSINKNNFFNFCIDIGIEFFLGNCIYFLKKKLELKKRNYFLEKLKNKKFDSYNEDIINNLNFIHIVFENENIVYWNKNFDEILGNFYKENFENSCFKSKLIKSNTDKPKNSLNINLTKNSSVLDQCVNFEKKSQRLINPKKMTYKFNKKKNLKQFEKLKKIEFQEKINKIKKYILEEKDFQIKNYSPEENIKINNEKDEIKNVINQYINNLKYNNQNNIKKNIFDSQVSVNFETLYQFLKIISKKSIVKKNLIEFEKKTDINLTKPISGELTELKSLANLNYDSISNQINLEKSNFFLKKKINQSLKEKNTEMFVLLGEFVSYNKNFYVNKTKNEEKHFEIYFKRINKITEFLIKEITDKKLTQKHEMENIKKQKLFGKTADQFRTPLNSIVSIISKIKNTVDSKDLPNNNIDLSSIKNNQNLENDLNIVSDLSNYTINLISDIIHSYSTKNFNDIKIKCENVSLSKILIFNFDILKSLISCNDKKAISIKTVLKIDENLKNFNINTDEFRLNQIILNLLSNSVKFTKFGEIQITAELKYDSENNKKKILIKIQDTGIRIKNNHQESDEKNFVVNKMSSGFCSSICAKIAIRLNYKILFTLTENKGATFCIEIPIDQDPLEELELKLNEEIYIKRLENSIVQNKKNILSISSDEKDNSISSFITNRTKQINISEYGKQKLNYNYTSKSNFHKKDFKNKINPSSKSKDKTDRSFSNYIDLKQPEIIDNKTNRSYYNDCIETILDINNKLKYDRSIIKEIENLTENSSNIFNKSSKDKNINLSFDKNFTPIDKLDLLSETIVIKDENLNMKFDYNNANNKYFLKEKNINFNLQLETNSLNTDRTIKTFRNLFKSQRTNSSKIKLNLIDDSFINSNSPKPCFIIDNNESIFENSKNIVIIIDDNKFIRESQKNLLEKILKNFNILNQFEIIEGGDGIDLLKYIIDYSYVQRIKFIIVDENMEYMNGSDAIRIIRQMEKESKILKTKIISCTCFENSITEDFILKSGADLVIKKPLSRNNLIKELIKLKAL